MEKNLENKMKKKKIILVQRNQRCIEYVWWMFDEKKKKEKNNWTTTTEIISRMNNETGIKIKRDLQNKTKIGARRQKYQMMDREERGGLQNVFGNGSKLQEEYILYYFLSCTKYE